MVFFIIQLVLHYSKIISVQPKPMPKNTKHGQKPGIMLFQIRLAHELAGMIALKESKYELAQQEFKLANQQNPYNLYRMALACKGSGDSEAAKMYCEKAAKFNALNNMNYAFIKSKAEKMLASL